MKMSQSSISVRLVQLKVLRRLQTQYIHRILEHTLFPSAGTEVCSPRTIHKDTVEIACRNVPAGESRAESHLDYRNRVWSLWPCKCSHWQKETKNMFQHSFTAGKYFRKKTFHLFIFWQQHRRIMDYLTGINSRNRSVKWT